MFHVSTTVAESFPTTTRITKTSFLLNVQRYYSRSSGTKHNLSDPIYYINFLHTLRKARPIDVAAEIESNDIPTPTGRMLVAEMG
jgi:ABC-type microcin C transport system permease subunit YejB